MKSIGMMRHFIPYLFASKKDKIKATDELIFTIEVDDLSLGEDLFTDGIKIGTFNSKVLSEQILPIENWKLNVPAAAKDAKQMWMVVRYKADK